jgi:hypothetical protein
MLTILTCLIVGLFVGAIGASILSCSEIEFKSGNVFFGGLWGGIGGLLLAFSILCILAVIDWFLSLIVRIFS